MTFKIAWTTDDGEWNALLAAAREHGPDSIYDRGLDARNDKLMGSIWFMQDGNYARPVSAPLARWLEFSVWAQRGGGATRPDKTSLSEGIDLSLIDLAWQLAYILQVEGFESACDGALANYHETDDAMAIRFVKDNGHILILTNTSRDVGWTVMTSASEFFLGLHEFLTSLSTDIYTRCPDLFQWHTFQPLRPYIRGASNQSEQP